MAAAAGIRHAVYGRAKPVNSVVVMLVLMVLMFVRAIIPNGYMIDPAAASAGHYALMPCPATGWRWPVQPMAGAGTHAGMALAHAVQAGPLVVSHTVQSAPDAHAAHHGNAGDDSSAQHISVECPTGIMLSHAVAPAMWWAPILALVPSWVRAIPQPVAPRIAYGPICGPPVGAQAPPVLS